MPTQAPLPKFSEIAILTHPDAAEGMSDALLSIGAKGVVEERRPDTVRLLAYLPAEQKLDRQVQRLQSRLNALERQGLAIAPGTIGIRTLEARAWADAWQDHFQIVNIGPGLVVAPSWKNYRPKPGEAVVVLDPGAAFGTGGHATTRLCLQGLRSHLRPGDRVADVGSGSGILAIAAALLGARQVIAADNDTTTVPVAQANAQRNNVSERIQFIECDLLPDPSEPFDLIVCNIISEEVIRLAQRLPGALKPGGRLIGSGFVAPSLVRVGDALSRAGLTLVEELDEEGWAACVYALPDPAL